MISKELLQIGNPLLSQKSKRVKGLTSKKTREVVRNLIDSMRYHGLVGMAASQIGEKLRIFVTEIRKTPYRSPKDIDGLRVYVNPKITVFSKKEVVDYEGCGSVAYTKFFAPVKRPKKITIEAFDDKGTKFKLNADRLLSRVIQHEYDHLNGVEFLEKITDIKKSMSLEEYKKRIASKKL